MSSEFGFPIVSLQAGIRRVHLRVSTQQMQQIVLRAEYPAMLLLL
jgi:hypothetical protein